MENWDSTGGIGDIADHFGRTDAEIEQWIDRDPTFPEPVRDDSDSDIRLWDVNEIVEWYNDLWATDLDDPGAIEFYVRSNEASEDDPTDIEAGDDAARGNASPAVQS